MYSVKTISLIFEHQVHPMDYVYSCLGSRLQLLSEESDEAQLLLRYLYRWRNFMPSMSSKPP